MSLLLRSSVALITAAGMAWLAAVPATASVQGEARIEVPGHAVRADSLSQGDDVLAWTGENTWEPRPVFVFSGGQGQRSWMLEVYIAFTLPGGDSSSIVLSADDPVMTDRGPVTASRLVPGKDRLLSREGWAAIEKIEIGEFAGAMVEMSLGERPHPTDDPHGHLFVANGIAVGDMPLEMGWRDPDEDSLDDLLTASPARPLSSYRGALPLSRPVAASGPLLADHFSCIVAESKRLEKADPRGPWKARPQDACERPTVFRVVSRGTVDRNGHLHVGVVCPAGHRLSKVSFHQAGDVGDVRQLRLSRSAVHLGSSAAAAGSFLRATGTCTWMGG